MNALNIGFALCGSFCTFNKVIPQMIKLKDAGNNIIPIMSATAYSTDTRFGKASDFVAQIEEICGRKIIKSIPEAEPIGPRKLLDALIIAPATGNTIAKIACGITDTSVTMAAKAHIRNQRPLLIAISTNDGLGINGKNINFLAGIKGIYFVPYGQDDPHGKVNSLVADMEKIPDSLESALNGVQIQPVLKSN